MMPPTVSTGAKSKALPPAPPPWCIVLRRFLSRRLICITSCFSLFSLSSPVPFGTDPDNLSLLDTQLAIPASGASLHTFAYTPITNALCARSSPARLNPPASLDEEADLENIRSSRPLSSS